MWKLFNSFIKAFFHKSFIKALQKLYKKVAILHVLKHIV